MLLAWQMLVSGYSKILLEALVLLEVQYTSCHLMLSGYTFLISLCKNGPGKSIPNFKLHFILQFIVIISETDCKESKTDEQGQLNKDDAQEEGTIDEIVKEVDKGITEVLSDFRISNDEQLLLQTMMYVTFSFCFSLAEERGNGCRD